MEWKEYRLIDILDTLIDYRGKTPKKTTSGVPLITAKIIKNGRIGEPNEFIAYEDYSSWMVRGFPEVGDVVLTMEAPLGEVAQLQSKDIALAQRVVTLRGKKGVLDNTYLKYFFLSHEGRQRLRARETGTTVTGIKQAELREVLIPCPSYDIQKRIAAILSSLDARIENNNRINSNLEAQAQALYKSWFVDYEPFGGTMPEDWKVGTLGEICSFNKRKVGPKFANPIQYLDTGHLTEGVVEGYQRFNPGDKIPTSARRYVGEGDILFSLCRPNMRHYGLMTNPPANIVASTGFAVITASWSGYRYYIYQWLKQDGIIDNIHAVAEQSSTTYPTIDVDYLAGMNMIIPSIEDTEKFAFICRDLYSKIDSNYQESQRLAALRDTLLPKLMKGEINLA